MLLALQIIIIMNTIKNSVQLIGNLGKDIEFKELDSGKKLAKFTLATNDYYKNAAGEKVEETQWHNITAWGKLAENMEQILSKGETVALKGKLKYSQSEDKEGNKRYYTEVIANEFFKMSKKNESPF